MKRTCHLYLISVAWLLSATAGAKLYSTLGTAKVLDVPEALLPMSIRHALVIIGAIELAIALVVFFGRNETIKLVCVAWLGGNFLLYRVAAVLLTVGKPCPCLGSITEKIPLKPATIDHILTGIVMYLIFGSLFFLLTRKEWDHPKSENGGSRVEDGGEGGVPQLKIQN